MADTKAAPVDNDDVRNDDDNVSGDGDGGEDGDLEGRQEYVKKVYVARPYECNSGVLEEIQDSIVKEKRSLMQMRISRPRRDFEQDGFNFIDKEATENSTPLQG